MFIQLSNSEDLKMASIIFIFACASDKPLVKVFGALLDYTYKCEGNILSMINMSKTNGIYINELNINCLAVF